MKLCVIVNEAYNFHKKPMFVPKAVLLSFGFSALVQYWAECDWETALK